MGPRGSVGARTSASASGARCARTTATTAMPGATSPTIRPRSRAYKWGEDGIAGFCDDRQQLCFGIAVWNGVDPILKERMFGLTNAEGNHGEDVKEYYFYLDATPTSSYLKFRYRYPLDGYPYDDLVATNRDRSTARLRVRAARHRGVRRQPLRRRRRRVRQARPRGHRGAHHRGQPRAPRWRPFTCCRRCGSATRGGWAATRARCAPSATHPR